MTNTPNDESEIALIELQSLALEIATQDNFNPLYFFKSDNGINAASHFSLN
jgi:hypothetical protein